MTRLIDADALKDRLGIGGTKTSCRGCQYKFHWSVCDLEKVPSFVSVCSAIDDAPTVEAEPVIRCKDCKYSVDEYDDGECYCDYEKDLRYIKDWDHYCSWAEGKEG